MHNTILREKLIDEAEHLEMYDERDKEAMMAMIKSCPAEPQRQNYHFHFPTTRRLMLLVICCSRRRFWSLRNTLGQIQICFAKV